MKKSPSKILKFKSLNPQYELMKTSGQLLIKCDDNRQYSKTSCLRIHGVKVKEKESKDDVLNTLEKCYSTLMFHSIQMILTGLTTSVYRTLIITLGESKVHNHQI